MTSRFDRLRGLLRSKPPTHPPNERPEEPPTIIVSVHRAFDQTRTCIQSILARTSSPYRLILIGDASPDDKPLDEFREQLGETISKLKPAPPEE